MKKFSYTAILMVAVTGLLFSYLETKKDSSGWPSPAQQTIAKRKSELKRWEATPDGVRFIQWKASPAGQKVLKGAARAGQNINSPAPIEAVITSLSLPPGSRMGFGIMVKIDREDYILSFAQESPDGFQKLASLNINDRIMVRYSAVSYAPKYSYPMLAGIYVERNGKILYKRVRKNDGC